MRIAGTGPKAVAYSVSTRAPVGVSSSAWMPLEYTGASPRIRSVAGAGTGNTPWADRTMPPPTFIGDTTMRSAANHSSANTAPTMSMIESIAPTSCRWTCSIDIPWIAASASASRMNIRTARAWPDALNADRAIAARMCFRW